jgi:predicted RNA-binding protein
MAYWLVPIQEDMWNIILNQKIYGYNRPSIKEYIKKDDYIIVYVSKYYAKKLGGKIVGIFKVISDWFVDQKPIFPEEIVRGKGVYVYRIQLEPVTIGECDFKSILPKVSFIEDRFQLPKYLRNAPANLRRPIPENDVKLIQECLSTVPQE